MVHAVHCVMDLQLNPLIIIIIIVKCLHVLYSGSIYKIIILPVQDSLV